MTRPDLRARLFSATDEARDEIVEFTRQLIRHPTVNPPGDAYEPCAHLIGDTLARCGFDVEYYTATDCAEHSSRHPRVNVVGRRQGRRSRPTVHLNGHVDVVPVGDLWTRDPFGGEVHEGRIYGRGACDMKAGIAAAVYAAEVIRRAGIQLNGTIEISGTADEESGGWAGVAHLARIGRLSAANTDFVIIPEPLDVDRICVGHRGVYWFEIVTHGRIGHGSMPFLGINAITHMGAVLHAMEQQLLPALRDRVTSMPVVPDGARHATLNVNTIAGGQVGYGVQTSCVADRCAAIFDRRFLIEEDLEDVRREIVALLEGVRSRVPQFRYDLTDLMVVHPVRTPDESPLIASLRRNIVEVLGRDASIVASPGTYDHKHVTRLAGIAHCVAYGPGVLELAHQPDEWCAIDDLLSSTRVLAMALVDLLGAD